MALTQLAPPYPIFTDKNGDPLDAGFIYFGEPNLNPETNPITVYYDRGFTQPVAQPLRTLNGYIMRNGSPALIYADSQFSVTIRDKNNALVIYSPVGFGVIPGIPSATFENSARDVPSLLADTQFTYAAGIPNTIQVATGDILRTLAEGFSYEVAASGATNQDLTTAGGVKLYGVNGALPILDGGTSIHSDGTDALSSSTRYFIGNNAPSTDDSGLLIGRGITGSYVSGAHAVRDESAMSMTGTGLLAYASFDAIPSMSGAVNYNHLRGFQARPEYSGSAQIDEVSGYQTQITHSGVGVITEAYGLRVDPILATSGGFVGTHYGLFVGDLEASGAVGGGFAIYSGFTNIASYHGGLFQFGTAPQISAAGFTTFGAILSHDASGNLVTNPNLTIINGVLDMKNATTSKVQASASFKLELEAVGIVESKKPLQLPSYTVATLPSPASAYSYCRAFVSDANATTFNSVVAGGGANTVPVYSDGTNWRIG